MVADHYKDMWQEKSWFPGQLGGGTVPAISRAEFDELKRQVSEMAELLKRAKAYDEKNNEPECELEEKVAILRKVAKLVGVDISAITPTKEGTRI